MISTAAIGGVSGFCKAFPWLQSVRQLHPTQLCARLPCMLQLGV